MAEFRVTKYAPDLRSPNGAYSRDDWTSVTDVGRMYEGRVLTCADYVEVESAYVTAVRSFLDAAGVKTLRVTNLEVNEIDSRSLPTGIAGETRTHAADVVDGGDVSGGDLEWIVRLALREAIWCRLVGAHGFFVHFGYDFCMYVGSDRLGPVAPSLPPGIFAEQLESPWHSDSGADEDTR